MGVGDVWRCACSGIVGDLVPGPDGVQSTWVNVFHLQHLTGAGTNDEVAEGCRTALQATYQNLAFGELFGDFVFLTKIVADKQGDAFTKEFPLTVPLGQEEVLPMPAQVCVAVTGRSDEVGRRVTLYFAGIAESLLGTAGELAPIGQTDAMSDVFDTKFGGGFSFNCVMFDRAGVLPTLIIDIYKVSANWRTQRRRVLTAENNHPTVYKPVGQ